MAAQYSISATGKFGPKIIFNIIRRIDMSMALGNLAQELVRPYSDRYVVTSVQVGSSETGPFKDALLTDPCVILSDMGYRYMECMRWRRRTSCRRAGCAGTECLHCADGLTGAIKDCHSSEKEDTQCWHRRTSTDFAMKGTSYFTSEYCAQLLNLVAQIL